MSPENISKQEVKANGAPGRTRTCDLRIRSPLLYPAELRALVLLFRAASDLIPSLSVFVSLSLLQSYPQDMIYVIGESYRMRVAFHSRTSHCRCRTGINWGWI